MVPRTTRRAYLTALAGAGALGAAGAAAGSQGPCDEVEDLEAELESLRAEVAEMRTTVAEAPDDIRSLKRDVMALHASQQGSHRFDQATRERALDVGRTVRESTVVIDVAYTHGGAYGTGWFVGDGLVMTVAHNVDDPHEKLGLQTLDGETMSAEIVEYVDDRNPDVALLSVDHDAPALSLGDESTLSKGDPVVQVGHPGGFGYWVVSLGDYRKTKTLGGHGENLAIDIPVLSGNSGSAVVDMDGNVVGLTSSSSTAASTWDDGVPVPHDGDPEYRLLTAPKTMDAVPASVVQEKLEAWT
jgi:serine protease Do